MSRTLGRALIAIVCLSLSSAALAAPVAERLEHGFAQPPDSARPHTWWHWMNGNITREGITADLEAMARVGVGGAQIFDVQPGTPMGPVAYGSDEWRQLVKHAITEADRLGVEICMHNCAGWSSSGGPWVTPDHAMQMVVTTVTRLQGPTRFDGVLPQSMTRVGFYRDIAVLAYSTPAAETVRMYDAKPTITASSPDFDWAPLIDEDWSTIATLRFGEADPAYIQFEFPDPFTARAMTIAPTPGGAGSGELQVSDDGAEFRAVTRFGVPGTGILPNPATVSFEPVTGRFFRLVFDRGGRRGAMARIADLVLESGSRISNWAAKAGYTRADNPAPDTREASPDSVVPHEGVQDISASMDAQGRLAWDVPEGNWTVIRFGYTPTGKDNHPASESGRGLECDKMSQEALDAHFDALMAKVISDVGPLAGKSFKHVLIDSYEVDCQNWTPLFRQEFERLRGYDPLPYLPAMTGRVVDSVDRAERFLWDVRRTIADLFAEHYFGRFAERLHEHGMLLSAEPYGNGGFEDLQAGGQADIPMTEFWVGWGGDLQGPKLASSMAHTQGRKYVGAESFTADWNNGRWQNHPAQLKALGDLIYTGGVNRFIFHRYAHQPWIGVVPGMTMGPWGFHFERTETWWEQGSAWLKYLARCQYMLQEGRFVGDLCYFDGEGAPASLPGRGGLDPSPPAGYDYDGCDEDVILNRMSVRDGRIVLPDGMTYRALVLPPSRTMTPKLVLKIAELVGDGATVIGPKPLRSPSLQDAPGCDAEVDALADEVWGDCDGTTVTERAYGKGRVIWGKPLADVFAEWNLAPDLQVVSATRTGVTYIHRLADGADTYFVACQNARPEVVECAFRVPDRAPELWHPESGTVEPAPVYRVEGGRTIVPLRFDPSGSVFVVFRQPATGDPIVSASHDGRPLLDPPVATAADLQIVRAVYGLLTNELPDMVDVTKQLQGMVRDNQLTVDATNGLAGDPAPNVVKQLRVDYTIGELSRTKTVGENEKLAIPEAADAGKGELTIKRAVYGLIPEQLPDLSATHTVDVTEILRKIVQNGSLSVRADNSLAGDPANLVPKQMSVEYTVGGETFTRTVSENQMLEIPDGTEDGLTSSAAPGADLDTSKPGLPVLTAWQEGTYAATAASGKQLRAVVQSVPEPLDVTGPWALRFPPNLGAPESATFDELKSWTTSDDPGIRYFSGTATYATTFNIPAGLKREGIVLMLDLGRVREIAEVRLNGIDLGILWKAPFRVDITDAAKAGENTLEVRVTNLWPNRLIGDEQLPDDCEWNGDGSLKAWPEWFTKGEPRPTARITFTTWKHWHKDSPLIDSGLLGPVRVWVGRKLPMGER